MWSRLFFCFFFSSRRRHTRWPRDWSSDVCSSDLPVVDGARPGRSPGPDAREQDPGHPRRRKPRRAAGVLRRRGDELRGHGRDRGRPRSRAGRRRRGSRRSGPWLLLAHGCRDAQARGGGRSRPRRAALAAGARDARAGRALARGGLARSDQRLPTTVRVISVTVGGGAEPPNGEMQAPVTSPVSVREALLDGAAMKPLTVPDWEEELAI